MRWLLLDEVLAIKKQQFARTRSRVPSAAYTAELLMMEMMAQTGALLVGAENDFREDLIFAKIEEASFNQPFREGETIHIEATSENLRPEGAWLEATIYGMRGLIARARFLLMNVGHFLPGKTSPITFHDNFMNYFQIREKIQ